MADLLTAITHYCNYQERCHKDVRNKLYELGADSGEVDQYLTKMIELDLLNEQRYAESFVRGHFNNKSWGRSRIIHCLKLHGVSEYCITTALHQIMQEDYEKKIYKVAKAKWNTLQADSISVRKLKVKRFLLQRGFEFIMIDKVLHEITGK